MARGDPWKTKPIRELANRLGTDGFNLDARTRDGLQDLLSHANGTRTSGRLTLDELLQTMADAHASREEYAFRLPADQAPVMTACMVARAGYERWVVGATACNASDPTPSGCAAWKLPLWSDRDNNTKRLASWAFKFDPGKLGIGFVPPVVTAKRTKADDARERELLAEVIAAPADDAPRLVYADWLGDRDPARSEFIVVQCELEFAKGPRRAALQKRADELRVAHGDAWGFEWCNSYSFRRGFVFAVDARAKLLVAHAATFFATTPLEHFATHVETLAELASLLKLSGLARLTTLVLSASISNGVVKLLAGTRLLDNVTTLSLWVHSLEEADAALLAQPSTLPALKKLQLARSNPPNIVRVISARPGVSVSRR
jgi:uncharacterized protein (TIGR02996 family)